MHVVVNVDSLVTNIVQFTGTEQLVTQHIEVLGDTVLRYSAAVDIMEVLTTVKVCI